jgi:hypothetical protein
MSTVQTVTQTIGLKRTLRFRDLMLFYPDFRNSRDLALIACHGSLFHICP